MTKENNRTTRAKEAIKHIDDLLLRHKAEIIECIHNTCTTAPPVDGVPRFGETVTEIYKTDSVTSLFVGTRNDKESIHCVLNFASYLHPGGGFLTGAKAQEEDLCMRSALYPILNAYDTVWYYAHRQNPGKFYDDDFLYTRKVPFLNGDSVAYADVLTMAAVNFNKLKTPEDMDQGRTHMDERMRRAFLIPAAFGAEKVILGAWGCGVFRNDPEVVASGWKQITEEFNGFYKTVVHAIPDAKTYDIFRSAYGL